MATLAADPSQTASTNGGPVAHQNPRAMVQVMLDKTQSAGAHEATLLNQDWARERIQFATDFVIGSSPWHQISHTKGGVLDGVVASEGSTNWSDSGEGTGIKLDQAAQDPGFKAQNNTLSVYVNPYEVAKFAARLDYEHGVAAAQPQPNFPKEIKDPIRGTPSDNVADGGS